MKMPCMRTRTCLCLLAVFAWLMTFFWGLRPGCRAEEAPEEPVVRAVSIRVKDPSPDAGMLKELAGSLIHLKIGAPLSLERLKESIDALKQSGLFEKIHIPDPVETDGKIEVVFELTPFSLIKKIRIDGEFPLLEQDILREMETRVGDPFDPKAVSKMEKNILEAFKKDGYVDPKATVSSRKDAADGRTVLTVSIQKGPFYQIVRTSAKGNRSYTDIELLTRLKSWQASRLFGGMARFVAKDLETDVKNLLRFYRRQGYADAKIEPSVEKDSAAGRVEILFAITEGPRYEVAFSGNAAFSDLTLKKDLLIFERGNRGDLTLKRGLRDLQERYRQAGFSEAKLAVKDETAEQDGILVRSLKIRIDEGPQTLLRSLRIEGNRAVASKEIQEKLLSQPAGLGKTGAFSSGTWQDDKRAVLALYFQNGFRSAKIEDSLAFEKDPETGNRWADAVLRIDEGAQTVVGRVTFQGLSVLSEAQALEALALRPGTPFREYRISSDKAALTEKVSEKGHPHAAVSAETAFRDEGGTADIAYRVDEGPLVKVGRLFVRGNFRTRRSVVVDRVSIRPEEPLSLKALLDSTRKVSRIQAFDDVNLQLAGYDDKKERVDVLFNVNERKPYLFEIGAGYDTAREFYLLGRLEDRNLLGINKSVWAGGEYGQISYRGEAGITDPDFFRTGISATGSIFTEGQEKKNQDFGVRNTGARVSFQKALWKNIEGGFAYRFEARKQYRLDDTPIPPEDQEQYENRRLFVLTPSLHYSTVDSLVRPKKGLIARASVDFSKGLNTTLDDFFRHRLEIRYYYTPADRLTFALRARGGLIQSYSSEDNVADDQLFYLGGLGDVRGFEENRLRTDASGDALGGRVEFLGNLEARYDLGSNFEASVFFDWGAVRDAEIEEGADDFRSSVGVGLSYITPVGPISLMYGHKLDRKEGESSGRIHFSIGYTF